MSHPKAKKLVEKLLESPGQVPVDDIIAWTPALFDDMLMSEFEGAGVSEIPPKAWAAIEAEPGSPVDHAALVELSSWLNSNWPKLCAIEIDGEECPPLWRRMSWTPELASRVLSEM